ncbi:hypothetical protein [Macrococcus carouselicus]|nr:hypothetical protein [Macrococcus carouselicus]
MPAASILPAGTSFAGVVRVTIGSTEQNTVIIDRFEHYFEEEL